MNVEQKWSDALSQLLSEKEHQVRLVASLLGDVVAGEIMLGQDGWHFPRELLRAGDSRLPAFRSPLLDPLYRTLVELGEARLDDLSGRKLVEAHHSILYASLLQCVDVGFKVGYRLGRTSKSAPARRNAVNRALSALGTLVQGRPSHEVSRQSSSLLDELQADRALAAIDWSAEGRLQPLAAIQVFAMSARAGWYVPKFIEDLTAYQQEVVRCALVAGCGIARETWLRQVMTGTYAQRLDDARYWMRATDSDETWSKAEHGDLASLMLYISGLPYLRELNSGVRVRCKAARRPPSP